MDQGEGTTLSAIRVGMYVVRECQIGARIARLTWGVNHNLSNGQAYDEAQHIAQLKRHKVVWAMSL